MIQNGDVFPEATVYEFHNEATDTCTAGPNKVKTTDLTKDKKLIIFGLPGAFTPVCSVAHIPGFLEHYPAFQAAGIEICCISVNDAFVMGAWAETQQTYNKIRMLADGNAELTKALGLEVDLSAHGMGIRSQRYAMAVENGIVRAVWVESPGKYDVSSAEFVLKNLPF